MRIKLTNPQIEVLESAAREKRGGVYAVAYYKPVQKLVELGLLDNGAGGKGGPLTTRWYITEAGRKWLAENPR